MPKHVRVTTPVGTASYPWLKEPDTKFNKDGIYSCNVFIEKDKATELIKKIDDVYDANVETVKTETGKAKVKPADKPYVIEGDKVLFKIKTKAKIGDAVIRPAVVDTKGAVVNNVDIYGGSEVKVATDLVPYYVATTGAGVTLRLIGVQIIKLQEKPMPSMESLGFKEEEGFEATENEQEETKVTNETQETEKDDFI